LRFNHSSDFETILKGISRSTPYPSDCSLALAN
jgi:hypothetical protein